MDTSCALSFDGSDGSYDRQITLYAKWSSAGVGVTVTDPDEKISLTRSAPDSDGDITFTATTNLSANFTWYVDGEDASVTGNTFTFNKNTHPKGLYTITVECGGYSVTQTVIAAIGTKLSPDSAGDIVFNDGSATPYSDDLTLTAQQKAAALAVIFYAGTDCSNDSTSKILGVGLTVHNYEDEGPRYIWADSYVAGYNTNFTGIQCTPSAEGSFEATTATFTGDKDGSDNWAYISSIDSTGTADAQTNYSMFDYANKYGLTNSLTGIYAYGWYIPSLAELCYFSRNKETVLAAFTLLEKELKDWGTFSSSSQKADEDSYFWALSLSDSGICSYPKHQSINDFICIRAF